MEKTKQGAAMSDEKLRSKLARILSTKKSAVKLEGKAEDASDVTVARCKVGSSCFIVVMKEGCTPQVYRRVGWYDDE